ncbi:MAG TPA: DUF4157 domain-containing protein, partial [Kofleriaceae bacterium]|nr:DUF4157 domain-containing protein [Kofleriaceae bacterium]
AGPSDEEVHAAAADGTRGAGAALPHLDAIQRSFGRHDVSGIRAHTDDAAARGARAMGAEAFATGDHVAFAGAPSLHTAAHEAAHVVQQRAGVHLKGGVGAEGDDHERHADRVADHVVRGESAEALLDRYSGGGGGGAGGAGVQRLVTEDAMTNAIAVGRGFGDAKDEKPLAAEQASWRDVFSANLERDHVVATYRAIVAKIPEIRHADVNQLVRSDEALAGKSTEELRALIPLARRVLSGIEDLKALGSDAELKAGFTAFKEQLGAYHELLKTSRAEGLLKSPPFVLDQVFGKYTYTKTVRDKAGKATGQEQRTVQGASAGNLDVEVGDALAKMYDLKQAATEFIALLKTKGRKELVDHFTQLRDQQLDRDKDYLHAGLKASHGMTTMNLQVAISKGRQLLGGVDDKAAGVPFANEGDKLAIDTRAGYLDPKQVPGFEAFKKADPTRAAWLAAMEPGANAGGASAGGAHPASAGAANPASAGAANAANPGGANGPGAPKPGAPKPGAARPNLDHLSAERTLGSGGEGEVGLFESHEADYDASLPASHRPRYAGKTTRAGGREGHNLFREAAAYAQLGDHRNLPKVHGFGVVPHGQDKRPALIMDFVQGPNGEQAMLTLKTQMEQGTITPVEYWGSIQFLTRRLVDVIKHLASHGIAHNDIKPENFVIGADGEPRLIDLGLHSKAGEHEQGTATEIRGLSDKLAPSQLTRKVRSGEETDLFLVAASMLAGVSGWTHSSKGAWQPRRGLKDAPEVAAQASGDDLGGRNLLGEFRTFIAKVIKPDAQAEEKIAAVEAMPFLAKPLINDRAAQNVLKGTAPAEVRAPSLGEQLEGLRDPVVGPDGQEAVKGTYVTARTPPRDEGEDKRARMRAERAAAEARQAGDAPAGGAGAAGPAGGAAPH